MATKYDIKAFDGFPNGTSLQGYVSSNYQELVDALGEPDEFDGDKTNVEWVRLINGVLVTSYDWKLDEVPKDQYDWHVGGHSTEAVELLWALLEEWPQVSWLSPKQYCDCITCRDHRWGGINDYAP